MSSGPTIGNINPVAILQGISSGTSTGGTTSVPPGIVALPNGTLIRGEVIQIDRSGNIILSTAKGDLPLKTEVPLTLGSELVLRLETLNAGLRARIISVDGHTPKDMENAARVSAPSLTARADEVVDTVRDKSIPLSGDSAKAALNRLDSPSVEVKLPVDILLKAVLLSRSSDLPLLLKELPNSIPVPAQRLEAGAVLTVKLLPHTIQLPVLANTPAPVPAALVNLLGANGAYPAVLSPEQLNVAATFAQSIPANTSPATTMAGGNTAGMPLPPPAQNTAPMPGSALPNTALPSSPLMGTGTLANAAAPTSPPASASGVIPAAPFAANQAVPAQVGSGITGATTTPAGAVPSLSTASPASPAVLTPATPGMGSNTAMTLPPMMAPAAGAGTTTAAPAPNPQQLMAANAAYATSNAQGTPPAIAGMNQPPASPAMPVTGMIAQPTTAMTGAAANTMEVTQALRQGLLPAEVIGVEKSGETVLRTPIGILKMELPQLTPDRAGLPAGTRLMLELTMLQADSDLPMAGLSQLADGDLPPANLLELSSRWNTLRDVLGLLAQTHPAFAQQILADAIPRPGSRMATSTLFFLSALKGGDLKQWLGSRATDALEQMNRGDLLRKLTSEFAALRQFFTESSAPNWQAAFVPVLEGQDWQQARLFIKKHPGQQSGQDAAGTRFIMEVELSQLGPMQMDGFVRKNGPSTLFDLILRSYVALPEADKQNIRTIFSDAAEMTGFKGAVSFQTAQPFPVLPMEEIVQHNRDLLA